MSSEKETFCRTFFRQKCTFFNGHSVQFPDILSLGTHLQGIESSDFSLISDFFPTPRTILEISVNLKRIFFRRWGYGYWGKMTPNSIGMHHLRPLNPKISWGRAPTPPPYKKPYPSTSFNYSCAPSIELGIAHFSDFFVKTHSDP